MDINFHEITKNFNDLVNDKLNIGDYAPPKLSLEITQLSKLGQKFLLCDLRSVKIDQICRYPVGNGICR